VLTILVGVSVFVCTTLHAAQARVLSTPNSPGYGNASFSEQIFTELQVSTTHVAIWLWPGLAMVATATYMLWSDDFALHHARRYFVIGTTMVISAFIFNLWKVLDDAHELTKKSESGIMSFELYICTEELVNTIIYTFTNPKYTIVMFITVFGMSFIHAPTTSLFYNKKFSQGHWAGVATQWVAFMMCFWYVHIMTWKNFGNNLQQVFQTGYGSTWESAQRGSTNIGYMNPLQPLIDVKNMIYDVGVRAVAKTVSEPPKLPMAHTTATLTVFMFPFVCTCLAVCVYFPARFGMSQRLIAGPC